MKAKATSSFWIVASVFCCEEIGMHAVWYLPGTHHDTGTGMHTVTDIPRIGWLGNVWLHTSTMADLMVSSEWPALFMQCMLFHKMYALYWWHTE